VSDRPIEFPVEGLSDGVVRLRLLTEADLPAVIEACQDPEIPRWTRLPEPYGEEDAMGWLAEEARLRAQGQGLHLLIVAADDGRLLGSVGAQELNLEEGRCELGYWMAREERGRGAGTRAVRLLARWIFESLQIERIQLCTEPANAASRRLAERAGFSFEGVLRSYIVNKGRRCDMAMYSLLREEAS
jgi:RimJ/RimL family protein N-acetyltransferase